MAKHVLTPPLKDTSHLVVGDEVLLTGVLYSARDAAHQRLMETLKRGEALPFPVVGAVLYYVGPCPAPPGCVIGSAGPTTASRMDEMTIPLLESGLKGMIGKGDRSFLVKEAVRAYGAVYLAALGGAGALLASRIHKAEVVAYADLGPEAIYRFEVREFPAVVAIDSQGGSIYTSGRTASE